MTMSPRRASSRRRSAITSSFQHLRPLTGFQLITLLLSISRPVASTPISYFPLNSQLPPVARASKPFSFAFSPLTFSSDSEMSYSLAEGSPSWLSLDSASRTLSGTPNDDSIPPGQMLVGIDIALVARDQTGSTSANATLVVSRSPGPIVRIPLENQIEKFGAYSAPASMLLHPSTEFRFEFDPNTFGVDTVENGNTRRETLSETRRNDQTTKRDEDGSVSPPAQQLNYYAVSGNNAPLPSWITFDASKLAFAGKTPSFESLVQPPQTFDFQLVASDVLGFSSAAIDFSIVVGTHELSAKKPVIELNATRDKEFEYTDLPNILEIDKRPLTNDDISSITADGLPAWLSFDQKSWKVSGKPGAEEPETNVTIAITDKFYDTLNVTLVIKFNTKIFLSDLPDINVLAGDDLSFDIKEFLLDPTDTTIKAGVQPGDSWIKFDDSAMVLSGKAPESPDPDFANDIQIVFDATQGRTKDKERKHLKIHVGTSTNTTGLSEPTQTSKPSKADNWGKDLYWLLIIPALLIPIGIFLGVVLIRRRRRQPKKLDFSQVSGPVPGSFVANGAMGGSSEPPDGMQQMQTTGQPAPFMRPDTRGPASSNPTAMVGHAISHATAVPPGSNGAAPAAATKNNRLTARLRKPSPAVTDELSLLSDTSLGDEIHIAEEHLYLKPGALRGHQYEHKIGLEIPTVAEPLSIQLTPELAYTGNKKKYDFVSDDEMTPAVSYAERRRSNHQQNPANGPRNAQRNSKAWKRTSASKTEDPKRNSQNSSSTDVTTRTSILISGITEEATTARTSSIVAKPTVVHIPSRPGEARQLSRRTDDSSTFFGGRSLTKSERNFRLAKTPAPTTPYPDPGPQPGFVKEHAARGSDSSWDRIARNSLGIAYRDLVQAKYPAAQDPGIGVAIGGEWKTQRTSEELMAPERWPIPDGMAAGGERQSWREDGLRVNRVREQKGVDEASRAAGRLPLADRSNETRDMRKTFSKRSMRTLRSNKSVRSAWPDDEDDEDAWEDIVPSESVSGGWEGDESDRSFSAYI
ncbi:hypothetical protein F4861DRAFT_202598 [Xylaria intraflava]|nr:hypothetical protein F4861DRAFT_202598 [Xylaria intraflava]